MDLSERNRMCFFNKGEENKVGKKQKKRGKRRKSSLILGPSLFYLDVETLLSLAPLASPVHAHKQHNAASQVGAHASLRIMGYGREIELDGNRNIC